MIKKEERGEERRKGGRKKKGREDEVRGRMMRATSAAFRRIKEEEILCLYANTYK